MPVRIYEFQEGLRLPNGERAHEHLGRLAIRCEREASPIEPGAYDFTPGTWERNPVQQRLLVHGERFATLQSLSRIANPVVATLFGGSELKDPDTSVQSYLLMPEEASYTGILASSSDGYGQEVWAIIYAGTEN